jgi:hypothetical protein
MKVKISWYCGMYVGTPKWQGTESYEPDECCTEGTAEVDKEDWDSGDAMVQCTKCGSELHQSMDHLELGEKFF